MARVYFYVVTAIILALLIEMAGLGAVTGDNDQSVRSIVGLEEGAEDIGFSSFTRNIFDANVGLLLAGVLTGLAASLFGKRTAENFIILPFITGILFVFVGTFATAINLAKDNALIGAPVVVIMGAFGIGYILSLVEFFRGNT